MQKKITQRLNAFKNDEQGSMAIELLIVTPILVWVLLATFVYFDVFRVEATSNKAAITVAEMFSREEVPIVDAYVDSALNVLAALTYEEENPDLRVTVYHYDSDDSAYKVIWSEPRGDFTTELTDADLLGFDTANRLPVLGGTDHAILVQTRVEYDAPFKMGIGDFSAISLEDVEFETFIVIRPRPGQLCFDDDPADDDAGLICDSEPPIT
ncbi:MAG: hypothetical protein AAFR90_15135 [Pseudomonadota bacterium]